MTDICYYRTDKCTIAENYDCSFYRDNGKYLEIYSMERSRWFESSYKDIKVVGKDWRCSYISVTEHEFNNYLMLRELEK